MALVLCQLQLLMVFYVQLLATAVVLWQYNGGTMMEVFDGSYGAKRGNECSEFYGGVLCCYERSDASLQKHKCNDKRRHEDNEKDELRLRVRNFRSDTQRRNK